MTAAQTTLHVAHRSAIPVVQFAKILVFALIRPALPQKKLKFAFSKHSSALSSGVTSNSSRRDCSSVLYLSFSSKNTTPSYRRQDGRSKGRQTTTRRRTPQKRRALATRNRRSRSVARSGSGVNQNAVNSRRIVKIGAAKTSQGGLVKGPTNKRALRPSANAADGRGEVPSTRRLCLWRFFLLKSLQRIDRNTRKEMRKTAGYIKFRRS